MLTAGRHERSAERFNLRDGSREIAVSRRGSASSVCDPEAAGLTLPTLSGTPTGSPKPLVTVIEEAWIGGVSTCCI
jgi:hypothetical protein